MEIFSLIAAAFMLFRPQVAASVNMDCGNVAIDLFFLIDSSGSVRKENFQKIKQFVADTIKQMTIGPHNVQIGLTAFSGIVRPQFNLNTYSSVGALINATMKVDYRDTGGTNTGQALEWIERNAFTKENGDRSDADNVLIVVTDGKSNNKHETLSRAADLHRHNITIYAIGVGGNEGLDMEELTAIATDRSHMIVVDTFDKLHSLGANITKRECNEKKRSDWYCRSSVCVHGTCVPLRSDYLCICQPGYIGKNCDVDEDDCRSQPCVYGECIDQVNGYHCQCSVMFSGKNCSKLRTWSAMAIALGAILLLSVCCCCRLCCPVRRRSDDDDEEENRGKRRPLPTKKVEAWPR